MFKEKHFDFLPKKLFLIAVKQSLLWKRGKLAFSNNISIFILHQSGVSFIIKLTHRLEISPSHRSLLHEYGLYSWKVNFSWINAAVSLMILSN